MPQERTAIEGTTNVMYFYIIYACPPIRYGHGPETFILRIGLEGGQICYALASSSEEEADYEADLTIP